MSRDFPFIHETTIIEGPKIKLPSSSHIEPGCIFCTGLNGSIDVGERNTFYPGVIFRTSSGRIKSGKDVSFGPGVKIYEVRSGLTIGDNTMIAAGVTICGTSHGMSTEKPMRFQEPSSEMIHIGKDVLIGMNSIIHPGVVIGNGAIIGSGSIVTRSIGAGWVAYGGASCTEKRRR
ncbi:DapH/DapD/GlmU-related protein [Synechococcus sp. LTW-R]|uniref:acyltransferase n=1 Tax=Synechococcus sp. LTW-R TaxID=2751170 RepID=UPI001628AA42|nr:acyltransferase [Synechococcus sp. LTW-R]QNG29601.1 acyltransferase [Synechococcus sp. LTW-R]